MSAELYLPAYQLHGPDDAALVVLAMGAGEQGSHWPRSLVDGLVNAGYRVLTYDARDTGPGMRFTDGWPADPRPIMGALIQGQDVALPYRLDDMAADITALIGAAQANCAHLLGISLGAMQAQLAAALFPDRVASLTSVMANSGDPALPPPNTEATAKLIAPVGPLSSAAAYRAHFVAVRKPMEGTAFRRSEAEWDELARRAAQTKAPPSGTVRQIAASLACRDRHLRLATITAPTLVIHGSRDPVMPMAGAEDTAARIPGAQLRVIDGMGHDLSEALGSHLLPILIDHFRAADLRHQQGSYS